MSLNPFVTVSMLEHEEIEVRGTSKLASYTGCLDDLDPPIDTEVIP